MITLKKGTKRAEAFINAYEKSRTEYLWQAYKGGGSEAKEEAFSFVGNLMCEEDGHGLRILGHNGFSFTCAYQVGGFLKVFTKNNIYLIN